MKSKRQKGKGLTLLEAVVASSILFLVLASLPVPMLNLYRMVMVSRDKAFAAQKASQMLEELRSFTSGGGETAIINLDSYSDGAPSSTNANAYKTVLTTDTNVVTPPNSLTANPADPLSGNSWTGTYWKFLRNIEVVPTTVSGARKVMVRVYYADPTNTSVARSGPALAEVTAVLQSLVNRNVPSQVYDVYALTLANVPGWWSDLNYLKPVFNNALNDMAVRNLGFESRTHYITRLAFGRDPYYAPYINETTSANADTNMLWSYIYPGNIYNRLSSSNTYYYVPADLDADGIRMLRDGNIDNGYSLNGSNYVVSDNGYSVADSFNHAVRYPEELAIYSRLKTAAAAAGQPGPEPTLRMLLEGLNGNDWNGLSTTPLRNAILINLHGELLPVPPIRNYADPARDPVNRPNLRVVTHPEKLDYGAGAASVKLRVYAYQMPAGSGGTTVPVTTVFIPTSTTQDATTARTAVGVQRMDGNGASPWPSASPTPSYTPYTLTAATQMTAAQYVLTPTPGPTPTPRAAPNQDGPGGQGFDYRVDVNPSFDEYNGQPSPMPTPGASAHPGVLITLYNTPTTCPWHKYTKTGLNSANADRLFNLDYIPNPNGISGTAGFDNWNLSGVDTSSASTRPKNTARWVITINTGTGGLTALGNPITIETRIGSDLSTGVRQDGTAKGHHIQQLANLSRTYTWLGSAPLTEKYQILGDPRYNPYLDVQTNNGYNWYFNSATATELANVSATDYPNFPRLQGTKWNNDDYDVATLFRFLREGLMYSNASFTSMAGYSFYYAGMGGEMGTNGSRTKFDMAGYPWNQGPPRASTAPLDFALLPASAVESESNNIANEIITDQRLVARTDKGWFSMPWLGELYPDAAFDSQWRVSGNLPAASSASTSNSTTYYRAPWNTAFTAGTIGGQRLKRLTEGGCTTFFNGSRTTGSNHFDHNYRTSSTATLSATLGTYLSQAFNMPLANSIQADRPFALSTTSGGSGSGLPPEWSQTEFSTRGTVLTYVDGTTAMSDTNAYYKHDDGSNWTGSSVIRVSPASGASESGRAYVIINGLAPQGSTATSFMARYAISTLLQSFFATGDYATTTASDANRTIQVPRIEIQSPKDGQEINSPNTIGIDWTPPTGTSIWTRWDKLAYTSSVPSGWKEPTSVTLNYQLMISADNGKTWTFTSDGATATPGTPSPSHYQTATTATVNGSGLADGPYLFRVECYRSSEPLHYSYHQREVFLNRLGSG